MGIYLDIGGSKTIIKFEDKKTFENFLKKFKKEEFEINEKDLFIIMPSLYIQEKKSFDNFLDFLKSFGEVVIIFPEPIYKNKIYSKKFPFLNGKSLNFKVYQDIKALAYYFAYNFFSDKSNKSKKLSVVILGTGINAVSLNYLEFKEKIFLDKLYETGHSLFIYGGKMCHCGREGCVERYLAGKYLKNELKVEDISSIKHIPYKKEEFHKRLAYFLSSILISQGVDKIILYGGLTNIVDTNLLKDFIKGILPFGVDLDFEIEINNDPLAQIKGAILLTKDETDSNEKKEKKNNKKSNKNGRKKKV